MEQVDPVKCIEQKFSNMLVYMTEKYPGQADYAALQGVSGVALLAAVRAQLLPHRRLVEAGDLEGLARTVEGQPGDFAGLARAASGDERVKRYLALFCALAE